MGDENRQHEHTPATKGAGTTSKLAVKDETHSDRTKNLGGPVKETVQRTASDCEQSVIEVVKLFEYILRIVTED